MYKIGDKYLKTLSIFTAYIVLAQLIEYFLWNNLSCNKTNDAISKLIPVYLIGQPLSILFALYYFKSSFVKPEILLAFIVLGICILLKTIYDMITSNKKLCSKKINNTLYWDTIYKGIISNYSSLFYNCTIFFILFLNNKLYSWISFFILVFTFLINIFYNVNWYSTWCFTSAFLPLILIMIKHFV